MQSSPVTQHFLKKTRDNFLLEACRMMSCVVWLNLKWSCALSAMIDGDLMYRDDRDLMYHDDRDLMYRDDRDLMYHDDRSSPVLV
jgi:hypothetical protein